MVANITPLPPAPVRGSTEATFSAAANLFVAALPTLVTEINTAGNDMELAVTAAQLAETNAETAETNAETAQAAAELAQSLSYASANFKGLWSSLVGALAKPASVAHNDLVWLLLNNLADVTASEPSTSNADWLIAAAPPTSVSLDVTANSNGITAGNVVELVSTGGQNVQNIYHCEAPTIGSLLTLDGTNNLGSLTMCPKDSNEVFVMFTGTGVSAKAAKIAAGSPPTLVGTATVFSGSGTFASASCQLDATHFAVVNANNAETKIITDNGTNAMTASAGASLGSIGAPVATCALTTSNWFVAYADTNSDCRILTAISNATNAPTLGTALPVNGTNNAAYLSLARTSDTTAMLVLQNTSDNNGEIAHITGGTTNAPTASTLAHLDGTNNCTFITQSPIDSNHTLCAYRKEVTAPLTCLAVIQANGTNAPTVISRAEFGLNLSSAYLSLTAHSSNLHTLVYAGYLTYGNVITVNVDSNYNLTLSQTGYTAGTNQSLYNAVASLTPTTAIAAFQGTGSDGFAGTLTLTPTPIISGQLVGIASTSATNGAAASVDVGPLVSGTYTSGLDYYAAGAGGLTTTATPVHAGKAKSTTELVLDLRGAPEAGKQQVWEITTPGAFTWTAPEDGEYEIIFCGGGGSGAQASTSTKPAGNGGNTVRVVAKIGGLSSITGTIGLGGAGQASSNTAGNNGGDTTVSILGITYIAKGGKGGIDNKNVDCHVNTDNDSYANNLLGTTGKYTPFGASFGQTGGVPQLLGANPKIAAGAATRGGGSWGAANSGTTGAGGDGVVRITLVHGSGK